MMIAVPFGFAGRKGIKVGLDTSRTTVISLALTTFSSHAQFSEPGAVPLYKGIGFSWALTVIIMGKYNKTARTDL
jgi:hypothetical protein